MSNPSQHDFTDYDIDELLKQRRQVAVIWSIDDVQEVRPNLTDDESWEVLQACRKYHDCTVGFSWDHIECVAGSLFPVPETSGEPEEVL